MAQQLAAITSLALTPATGYRHLILIAASVSFLRVGGGIGPLARTAEDGKVRISAIWRHVICRFAVLKRGSICLMTQPCYSEGWSVPDSIQDYSCTRSSFVCQELN